MWRFIAVADTNPFLSTFQYMQKDIAHNTFSINPHASQRIVDRGFGLADITDTVANGNMGVLPKRDGFINVCFVRNHIVVCASKPYGRENFHVAPTVTTVFRDDELYEPTLEELTIVPRVIEKEVCIPGPDRVVTKLPEDLSDEELEQLLAKRRRTIDQKILCIKERIGQLTVELTGLEDTRRAFGP